MFQYKLVTPKTFVVCSVILVNENENENVSLTNCFSETKIKTKKNFFN